MSEHPPNTPFGTVVTGTVGEYPPLSVNDLLASMEKLKEGQKAADEALLDALVDIVNRSPDKPHVWATRLGIDFTEFVQTCHRDRPVSNDFRNRVFNYFRRIQQEQNPSCGTG